MTTEKSESQPIESQRLESQKITPLSFMGSIIAAWFGVQTKANRERDFEQGKFHHFVIGGIIFAILFVLFVVGIVKVVMHFAVG
jgi:hypothetical protein